VAPQFPISGCLNIFFYCFQFLAVRGVRPPRGEQEETVEKIREKKSETTNKFC
jgi:hypothetical protein